MKKRNKIFHMINFNKDKDKVENKDNKTNKNNKKNEKNEKNKGDMSNNSNKIKKFSKIFLVIIILFSLLFIFISLPIYLDAKKSLPPLNLNKIKNRMSINTIVYDKNDVPINSLAEESFISVTYDQIPQSFIDAMISAEDSRFFSHKGVDGWRTSKAMVFNFLKKEITSGGSTITQQLIKLTSLHDKISDSENGLKYKHSNKRKIHEILLAMDLEKKMNKEEIFTSYANTISYGRFTGVGTAAKRYFNKNINQLTMPESILLAGIPQSSTQNNPFYSIESATERYKTICNLMERHNYIKKEECENLKNIPLSDILLTNQKDFIHKNGAFFDSIENELNQLLELNGKDEKDSALPYYYTGLKIYSTMDQEQQEYANKIMNTEEIVPYTQMLNNIRNGGTQKDNLQASFVVVDNKTGGVPAIGAARNYNGYNMALHGFRSPGSVIKPLIDYAPGVEKFNWNINTPFRDEKTFYTGSNIQVHNFTNTYTNGNVSLKDALSQSLNTCAVRAFQQVGPKYAGNFTSNLGITKISKLLENNELYESSALGGGIETTTYELAGAYSAFANGGIYNKPYFIRKIEDIDGQVLYEHKPQNIRVMSPNTAKVITDALQFTRNNGTPSSGGRKKVNSNIKFAAKTGTSSYDSNDRNKYNISSNAEKDHWIAGYSPEYSIATWTGFNVEDKDFFTQTRGNVNANKKYGSYIMSSWINKFSKINSDFNYDFKETEDISISDIPIKLDKELKHISWNKPNVFYSPNKTFNSDNIKYNIFYNLFLIDDTGKEIQVINREMNIKEYDFSNTKNIKKIKIIAFLDDKELPKSYKSEKTIDIL